MAKQVGPIYHEGTIGDIVYYKMNGQYYARFKGNYKSRKQMQRIPKYKRTLHYAKQFGKASSLASWVYNRYLPQELRKQGVFCKFSGKATRLNNEGKSEKEIKEALIHYCEQLTVEAPTAKETATTKTPTLGKANIGKANIGTAERRTMEHDARQARNLPSPAQKHPKAKSTLFAIPSPPNDPCSPMTTHNC